MKADAKKLAAWQARRAAMTRTWRARQAALKAKQKPLVDDPTVESDEALIARLTKFTREGY